ncbi:MAG: hypothetical protein HGA49_08655 [Eubacteriaceae bacterium]|nr:hypothetical protein [Eubacteriaceae bacterium]
MKIGLVSFQSSFQRGDALERSLKPFLSGIETELGEELHRIDLSTAKDYDVVISFIKTGGTENYFREAFEKLKEPYLLLSTGNNNSLAASMEILSFLRQQGLRGEILHGDHQFIAGRINKLRKIITTKNRLAGAKFGVVGKPSDWLISSGVDYSLIKEKSGIEMLDISMEEFKDEIRNRHSYSNRFIEEIRSKDFDKKQLEDSFYIYGALRFLVDKYGLSALTVRCFDLLEDVCNTGCLALGILNAEGIPAGCEGDIPSLISMAILHFLTGKPVFMANPSRIDMKKNKVIFAHCTMPVNMPEKFELDTHFESGIGVAVRGELKKGDGTVFKVSGDFSNHFVSGCQIERNLAENELCRSQVELTLDKDVRYFLHESIGNHHLITNGDHSALIKEFFKYF